MVDYGLKAWFYRAMNDIPLIDQANHAMSRNDLAIAEKLYKKILESEPDNCLALGNLSALMCQQNRPVEAESLLRPALERLPNFSDGFLNLGYSLQNQRRYIEAIDAYRQFVATDVNFSLTSE